MSTRTAACPARAPTVDRAALCLAVATPVHVPPDTQVLAALMTPMNVPPHPPSAKTMAYASTPLVLTSEFFTEECKRSLSRPTDINRMKWTLHPEGVAAPLGLLADTVKACTSLAHRHHA